jgi:hypothetical protein
MCKSCGILIVYADEKLVRGAEEIEDDIIKVFYEEILHRVNWIDLAQYMSFVGLL